MMPIDEVESFRKKFAHFLKWSSYMKKRRLKMDPETNSWKTMLSAYTKKVVDPMDEAWLKLTSEEQRLFGQEDGRVKQALVNNPF